MEVCVFMLLYIYIIYYIIFNLEYLVLWYCGTIATIAQALYMNMLYYNMYNMLMYTAIT